MLLVVGVLCDTISQWRQIFLSQRRRDREPQNIQFNYEMCGAGKAERAERSGLPRFFFGYFLCSNDKEMRSIQCG